MKKTLSANKTVVQIFDQKNVFLLLLRREIYLFNFVTNLPKGLFCYKFFVRYKEVRNILDKPAAVLTGDANMKGIDFQRRVITLL